VAAVFRVPGGPTQKCSVFRGHKPAQVYVPGPPLREEHRLGGGRLRLSPRAGVVRYRHLYGSEFPGAVRAVAERPVRADGAGEEGAGRGDVRLQRAIDSDLHAGGGHRVVILGDVLRHFMPSLKVSLRNVQVVRRSVLIRLPPVLPPLPVVLQLQVQV
jgi:hypothetical protein